MTSWNQSTEVPLEPFQESYLSLSLSSGILRFGGPFTLKSGRKSPYFFNAGTFFESGDALAELANCYAQAIVKSGVKFDVLFGPAYKGIPLAAITAVALSRDHGINVGFCFNRKEAKAHGEGGTLVGAPLAGRVLVLDDVMTAGTAVKESVGFISQAKENFKPQESKKNSGGKVLGPPELVGVVVALDRQERANDDPNSPSAIQNVMKLYGVNVMPVVNLDQIIRFMEKKGGFEKEIEGMRDYRKQYGVEA